MFILHTPRRFFFRQPSTNTRDRAYPSSILRTTALVPDQDAQSDGNEITSCRLVRAVKAVSRHTTDAHFVLVADGFELDALTKEIMVRFPLRDRLVCLLLFFLAP